MLSSAHAMPWLPARHSTNEGVLRSACSMLMNDGLSAAETRNRSPTLRVPRHNILRLLIGSPFRPLAGVCYTIGCRAMPSNAGQHPQGNAVYPMLVLYTRAIHPLKCHSIFMLLFEKFRFLIKFCTSRYISLEWRHIFTSRHICVILR